MLVGEVTHLSENGDADVAVAGLVDEIGQLVRRYRSRDGFLPRLRRQTHRQVLLVGQQSRAGLQREITGDQERELEKWQPEMILGLGMLFLTPLYRVQLLHLLLQHAGDHPDEAPVFQLTCLLIKVCQQRSHCGAFTIHTCVPVHPPNLKETQRGFFTPVWIR